MYLDQTSHRRDVLKAVGAIGLGAVGISGRAAAHPTQVDSCVTIDSPGRYVMTADVDHGYDNSRPCIEITADDVVFDGDGHEIIRTDVTPSILVMGDNVTVENVTLDKVWDPMEYVGTTDGTIRNVTSLGVYGVRLTRTTETQVVDSHFENDLLSIDLSESDDNTVRNNSIWGSDRGIDLSDSHGNVVSENAHSTGFGYGIGLNQSTDNTIRRNEVRGMSNWGYRLYHSDRNTLVRNQAIENYDGFSLSNSDDNRLVRNTACDNEHDIVIEGDSTGNERVRNSTTCT